MAYDLITEDSFIKKVLSELIIRYCRKKIGQQEFNIKQ